MSPRTPHKISEEELVYLLKIRDTSGLEYIYDHYSKALYNLIIQIVQAEELAEEVLQETFLRIWNNFAQYDDSKGRLFTWFSNIARNLSIDKLRSKDFKNSSKNQELENHVPAIDGFRNTTYNPDLMGLKELVSNLNPEQQQIVELVYFQGFTHAEVSERLEIPLGTVKTRLRTAIIVLRKYFN